MSLLLAVLLLCGMAPLTLSAGAVKSTRTANDFYAPQITIHSYVASRKIDYRSTITFTAIVSNPVSSGTVHWFIDGCDQGTGAVYTVQEAKRSFIVQAKYMKGSMLLAESEAETVIVNARLLNRVVAFFRGVTGRLPVIVQKQPDSSPKQRIEF